jgi:hypothetical protein
LQNQEKRMEAAVMVENASVSLTVETSQLWSSEGHVNGVKGGPKHAKHEANAHIKSWHYYVHKPKDAEQITDLKMKVKGLPTGQYMGISAMYNTHTQTQILEWK